MTNKARIIEELRFDKKQYARIKAFQKSLPEEERWRYNKTLGLIGEGINIWKQKLNEL